MFGQLCLANQLQRDLDSERMTRMQRQLFEAGRHRGHDPFGYRSRRDAAGNLVHPRELVIVPEEAAIVRRVWHELTQGSMAEVAELLDREGVPHRGPWGRESVKDIVRRGRKYLGFVVEKRGRDERPGQHEPILSEAQYRATMAAIAARTRARNKPQPFRQYLLRGLLWCTCGHDSVASSPRGSPRTGRRSGSLAGLPAPTRGSRLCGCRPRRSTAASSSRPGGC